MEGTKSERRLPCSCLVLAATVAGGILSGAEASGEVIGQWTFNEGSGTIALDSSGLGNNGTIMGGASYVDTPGGFGISLDGIDDVVDFGQPASLDFTTQAWTIEAWVSIDTDAQQSPEANHYGIFGKNTLSWLLGYEHGGSGGPSARHNVMIGVQGGTPTAEGPVDSARPSNSFHHLLATKGACDGPGCNTDPLQFYLDGACQGVCDAGGRLPVQSQAVNVVAGLGNGNYLECVIDELIVHDVRMNPSQAQAQYYAGPAGLPTTTVTQVTFPDAVSICFTGEVGTVYTLQSADSASGTYSNTGATITGTGGSRYLFDPESGSAIRTFYRVSEHP